jgi:hypothetical protein
MPYFSAISQSAAINNAPLLLVSADANAPLGRVVTGGDGIDVVDYGAGATFDIAVDTTVLRTNVDQTVTAAHTWRTDQAFKNAATVQLWNKTEDNYVALGYDSKNTYTFFFPDGVGDVNYVLTSDGSDPCQTSWQDVSTLLSIPVPGGSSTHVQFNSSGSFAGSSSLTWDGTDLRVAANVKANTETFVSGANVSCQLQYGPPPNGGLYLGKGIFLKGGTSYQDRPYIGFSTRGNSSASVSEIGWVGNTADYEISFGVGGIVMMTANGSSEVFTVGTGTPGTTNFRGKSTFVGGVTYGNVRRETAIFYRANETGTTGTPSIFEINNSAGSSTFWKADWNGNWYSSTVGCGLGLKEGTNAAMGTATLVGGTVVVSTTKVTANTRIFLTTQTTGGTMGVLYPSARTAGTSFTITSTSGTDTSTVAWLLVEPT